MTRKQFIEALVLHYPVAKDILEQHGVDLPVAMDMAAQYFFRENIQNTFVDIFREKYKELRKGWMTFDEE